MRERAEELGGRCTIGRSMKGTLVSVQLPCRIAEIQTARRSERDGEPSACS